MHTILFLTPCPGYVFVKYTQLGTSEKRVPQLRKCPHTWPEGKPVWHSLIHDTRYVLWLVQPRASGPRSYKRAG